MNERASTPPSTGREDELKMEIEMSPAPEDERVVWEGLSQHNEAYAPAAGDIPFAVFLREKKGSIVGGVVARAGRGWLHVRLLWVHASLRGQGHGARLMAAAEEEGRRRGCHGAYLSTFSFQARPFYEQCGYQVFGTLEDFPEGHQRFFMRKSLPR